MLVVEGKPNGDEVEIYADQAGLIELLKNLVFLLQGETHVHLNTPAWAGNELAEEVRGDGDNLVHHLKIVRVDSS